MKKIFSMFILMSVVMLSTGHLSSADTTKAETLYDFLQNNKEITARYEYPSWKVAETAKGYTINAHTPIIIKNDTEINTKYLLNNDTVNFHVLKDVKDKYDNILIKAGTDVSASISFSKKGFIGKSGEIVVSDFHTTAVDGSYIPLSSSIVASGEDKMVLSIVLSACLCPLFLLLKGKDAVVPANTTKTVYTISETKVKVQRL